MDRRFFTFRLKFDDSNQTMQGTINGEECTYNLNSDSDAYLVYAFTCPDGEPELLGDVDNDGEAGVIDATMIQRYDAGFNVPYPIGEEIA